MTRTFMAIVIARLAASWLTVMQILAVVSMLGDPRHPIWISAVQCGALLVSTGWFGLCALRGRPCLYPVVTVQALTAVVLVTWPWHRMSSESHATPWVYVTVAAVGAIGLAAYRWEWSVAVAIGLGLLWAHLRTYDHSGMSGPYAALLETMLIIVFVLVCAVGVAAALARAQTVDNARIARAEADLSAARAEAVAAERETVNAIVHDHVLTSLAAIGQSGSRTGSGLPTRVLQVEARQALERLQQSATADDERLEPLFPALRAASLDALPVTAVNVSGDPSVSIRIRYELQAALLEALRNVDRHVLSTADAATVSVDMSEDREKGQIVVIVTDDGPGFDPRRVPGDRLGLQVSIFQRMAEVGGAATIESARGKGTRLTLYWPGAAP
jgi:signal transduction histidine kinase